MKVRSLEPRAWPGGAEVAVAITVDFDAEAAGHPGDLSRERRLTALSEARYGARRGVERLCRVLRAAGVPATFYVPGITAERHPDVVGAILAAGRHEIGHHGYAHDPLDDLSASAQLEDLESGCAAIEELLGRSPVGFRAPFWQLTPATLAALPGAGFLYDSSLMEDDRPYEVSSDGDDWLVELPVHWTLDDAPLLGFVPGEGHVLADPETVLRLWLGEFRLAHAERRLLTLTLHPEISGRPAGADLLGRLLEGMQSSAPAWFCTHGQVVAHLRGASPEVSPARISSPPADPG